MGDQGRVKNRANKANADSHARAKIVSRGLMHTLRRHANPVSLAAMALAARPSRVSVARSSLRWLFTPLPSDKTYRQACADLLGVSVYTLRHYLAGRRIMPADVKARLIEMVEARLAQGQAVLAELRNAPVQPKRTMRLAHAGRARKARERDAAANQSRE